MINKERRYIAFELSFTAPVTPVLISKNSPPSGRNWLMPSAKGEIIKILAQGLPFTFA